MAAKTKTLADDAAIKARKKAELMKDEDEDEGEDMACSDDAGDDDADDKDDKKDKRGKKAPWMKSKKKAAKSADDDETMDEDEDSDDDEDDMDKSETFEADKLEKALSYMRDYYEENDDESRRDVLFAKAHSGAKMNKSERAELLALIDGSDEAGESESLAKSTTGAFSEEVGDTIEISDFLTAHHEGLKKSLAMLAEEIESLKKSQHEHNLMSARVQVECGELLKSLSHERQEELSQPARAPKARGAATPLAKSFSNRGEQERVQPALIKSALNDLAQQSHEAGRDGLSKSGYDFALAMAMFESHQELPEAVAGEVKAYLRSQRQAG